MRSGWGTVGSVLALFILGAVCATAGPSVAQDPTSFDTLFGSPDPFAVTQVAPEIGMRRVVMIAIACGAGFLFGIFCSPIAARFRLVLGVLILIVGVLYVYNSPDITAELLSWLLTYGGFLFFVGIGIGIGFAALRQATQRREREKPPISLGSARWADEAHLDRYQMLDGEGYFLGSYNGGRTNRILSYTGDRHLLTVAPTRSGKGVSAIVPNLLTHRGSAVVIDPKGENSMITAIRRGAGSVEGGIEGLGQQVYIVDPWNIAAARLGLAPARINPLDWIGADDPDVAENAFLIADAFVPSGATGESRFWDDEARALLMGIMLYVATSPEEAATRHLGRVRDIITSGDDAFAETLQRMFAHPNPVVSSTATRTAGKDTKLRANVLTSIQAHTHFLDSPRIRESLSASDFSFADPKTSAMTVYLVLPADRLQTFDRWLRILVQQAISINARSIEVRPARPILFMLDEMAALGRLTMVEQAFGLMAGFGMQLWGIVQDLSQLERIYGKGWETFISNSGVLQYFGSHDRMTAEYFSALCGVMTVRIYSFSQALGDAIGSATGWSSTTGDRGSTSSGRTGGTNESSSRTYTASSSEHQRQLAYPDELMVMHEASQLVLIENLNPISGLKVKWFDDPSLSPMGVNLHPTVHAAEPQKPRAQPVPSSAPPPGRAPGAEAFVSKADAEAVGRALRALGEKAWRLARAYPIPAVLVVAAWIAICLAIGFGAGIFFTIIGVVAGVIFLISKERDQRRG